MYQEVTNKILSALETAGPFKSPWASCLSIPHNGSTNRAYSGVNVLLLWLSGFSSPKWYTFAQAKKLGANVRKGETGTRLIFFQPIEKHTDGEGKSVPKEKAVQTATIPLLKTFVVFNKDQIEGLPEETVASGIEEDNQMASEFLDNMGNVIQWNGPYACYVPGEDVVILPAKQSFFSTEGLYSTAFHEIGHWTGHADRCNRNLEGRFGDDAYAFEELVAELTSAFLCAEFGVEGTGLQHPEYIKFWAARLKKDKHAIFSASREAVKAVKYLREMYLSHAEDADDAEAA